MPKRILSILIALIIVISTLLTACSEIPENSGAEDTSDVSDTSEDSSEPEDSSSAEEDSEEPALSENAWRTAKTAFPIVVDEITLKGMMPGDLKWEEQGVVKALEKLTNISIEMTVVPPETFEERKLVALASDEYPDFFYMAGLSAEQQMLYGQKSGALIDLLPMIEGGYAPNLSNFFYDADSAPTPTLASCLVDGKMYSLPYIYNGFDEGFIAINTAFLEKLELEMPQTTDQLLETLRKVKDGNPNGNKKSKEIGIASLYGSHYLTPFLGCFSIPTDGIYLDGSTVKLGAVQPEYKEFLEFFATCFEEELVDTRLKSNTVNDKDAVAELSANTIFMMYTGSTAVFGDHADDYTVFTLTDPANGKKVWSAPKDVEIGTFAITDKCEYPEAMLRWADYFYSAEGQKLLNMGVEGENYTLKEDEDGNSLWTPKKKAAATMSEWLTSFSILPTLTTVKAPGFYCYDIITTSSDEVAVKQSEYRLALNEITVPSYPTVTFTEDELAGLEGFAVLSNYIADMQLKFITGEADIEKDWDDYIEILEKYRVDSYVAIYQAAYDRYIESVK